MKAPHKAEVISIGDEMTSGQRLDTNSQWISNRLGDLGVQVAFHSTVGDNLADMRQVFGAAAERADLVVCTGGLGPTADDLTREVLAQVGNLELVYHPRVVDHIQSIFAKHSREMPESNRVQAYFPEGAEIIENPEGTAPGIDLVLPVSLEHDCRFFALPGVPAEMKQMWAGHVEPAVRDMIGGDRTILHHVIHCFGTGESQTEQMLPDLIRRDRDPRVGITASQATISLRVTAIGESVEDCRRHMQPTLDQIRQVMGDYVFGENGQTLEQVVSEQLVRENSSVAVADLGLKGDVARKLALVEAGQPRALAGAMTLNSKTAESLLNSVDARLDLSILAESVREHFGAGYGVAIGNIQFADRSFASGTYEIAISHPAGVERHLFQYGGHSSLRQQRSVKQVLNAFRLLLKRPAANG